MKQQPKYEVNLLITGLETTEIKPEEPNFFMMGIMENQDLDFFNENFSERTISSKGAQKKDSNPNQKSK